MPGWRRYACPESNRLWLWNDQTSECFWVDKPGGRGLGVVVGAGPAR